MQNCRDVILTFLASFFTHLFYFLFSFGSGAAFALQIRIQQLSNAVSGTKSWLEI
jgi:hypothetical protein